jgi:hypothetical protein
MPNGLNILKIWFRILWMIAMNLYIKHLLVVNLLAGNYYHSLIFLSGNRQNSRNWITMQMIEYSDLLAPGHRMLSYCVFLAILSEMEWQKKAHQCGGDGWPLWDDRFRIHLHCLRISSRSKDIFCHCCTSELCHF